MRKTVITLLLIILMPCLASAFYSAENMSEKGNANDLMREEVLAAHNKYRAELEIPPLAWSETLAAHAMQWANHLARSGGQLRHDNVSGEGENLWKGTANYYSHTQRVEYWVSEKRFFKSGVFPHVSTTGDWSDVGHYTQIIWRNTTEVGCAKATSGDRDIFVCRYAPQGNIFTQKQKNLYEDKLYLSAK